MVKLLDEQRVETTTPDRREPDRALSVVPVQTTGEGCDVFSFVSA